MFRQCVTVARSVQERVNRLRSQVLRYAYGGVPLWSSPTPPATRPPPCACGSPRRFELQLMPALLYLLDVDRHAPTASDLGAGGWDQPPSVPRVEGPRALDADVVVEGQGDQGDEEEGDEGEGGLSREREELRRMAATKLRSGGMDWGVVTVWSCEAACEQGKEEVVIVQAALEECA
jgi:hypothetical protein